MISPDPYLYSQRDGGKLIIIHVGDHLAVDRRGGQEDRGGGEQLLSASHNYLHHTVVWGWRDAVD